MSHLKVVLNPGHGGRDRRNMGPTEYVEADGTLSIALAAREALLESGLLIDVRMTRETDDDLASPEEWTLVSDLAARAETANGWLADLYVAIHTNASGAHDVRGTETYVQQASALSRSAGSMIHMQVVDTLKTPDRGVRTRDYDDGQIWPADKDPDVDTDYYAELRNLKVPAVLVEVDHHDHPVGEAKLLTPAYRQAAGEAIARGIIRWALSQGLLSAAFPDMPDDHWAAQDIAAARAVCLLMGDENGNFRPNDPVTRAELAVVLHRLMQTTVGKQ